ncbi:MAG: bifunctional 4-hydroxy-3-methylbut-2-enyl diphosphate reductase/30S ribosomal protein S1 [Bacillota bacterium]
MEITVAPYAGFCFGVKRALEAAQKEAENQTQPLYTLGPLIHNPQEVERLARRGLRPVEQLTEVDGGVLIIRSHGVEPGVLDEAHKKGLTVVDATCPFVKRAQEVARFLQEQGYQVVVVGDRLHPEVVGIVGWSGNNTVVVEDAAEATGLPLYPRIGVVAQTTQTAENLEEVTKVLSTKTEDLVVHNTICHATRQRQEATAELAKAVDIMIVVGGKNSANTQKLANICRAAGTPTYHVEQAKELCSQWFIDAHRVGVTAGASTPDWIIEEVVDTMVDFNEEEMKNTEMQANDESQEPVVSEPAPEPAATEPLAENETPEAGEATTGPVEPQLIENLKELHKGDIVSGTIVQVRDNEVLVDIGGKSEGIIPISELSHRNISDPNELVKTGEEIKVYILKVENEEGHPILSKKRADREVAWQYLEDSLENHTEISAEVVEIVKGGLLVDVGVRGFVPASLVERGYVENLNAYLGKQMRLRVIELDRTKNKAVLSQKVILDEEYEEQRQHTWEDLEEGQVKSGTVRRLTNFGAFVDIGGVDGLLHVSEISWGRVEHPSDVLREGQEVEVRILGVDRQSGKVSLGLKQLMSNPWDSAAERYPVGTIVNGKVLRIATFGAFVEIEPGIEGLVHISQLSDHHVAKTEDVLTVGEIIPVKVLSVDQLAQRMSLSLKEARPQEPKIQQPVEHQERTETGESSGVTLGDLFGDLFEDKGEK